MAQVSFIPSLGKGSVEQAFKYQQGGQERARKDVRASTLEEQPKNSMGLSVFLSLTLAAVP